MLQTSKNEKTFRFTAPLEIIKSDEKGWKVKGLASTEDRDLQGEIVRQDGLDISLLKKRGMFNYEHKNDPENLIGLVEDAQVTENGLEVEGYLFKKHARAQAIAQIMQSLDKSNSNRVQLSIEGKIKEGDRGREIRQATVERVAVTFEPVNQSTYLTLAKSLVAKDEIVETENTQSLNMADPTELVVTPELQKAIDEEEDKMKKVVTSNEENIDKTMTAAGGDAAPATLTGGAALQRESVKSELIDLKDDGVKEKKGKKKLPAALREKIKKHIMDAITSNPDIPADVILKHFRQRVYDNYKNRILETGSVVQIEGKPYIKEPNGIYAPIKE